MTVEKTGTELMTMDDAMLAELAGMVAPEDASGPQIPVLKINYDAESKYPRGTWVVGQQKDKEGTIVDEGMAVKALVILTTRNRFSYYNQTDITKNCNSPFHGYGQSVKGSKYKNVCGKDCPLRDTTLNPRCKAQKVVFGVAITEDGKAVDCVAYIQGDSYMPFVDYMKGLTRKKTKGGFIDIPPFTYVTLLESEKKKNAGTTYFAGIFKQGNMFEINQVKHFADKRDKVQEYIDRLNTFTKKSDEEKEERAAIAAEAETEPDVPDTIFKSGSPIIDVGEEPEEVKATDDVDFDIEAAIMNAVKAPAAGKGAAAATK